MNSNVVNKNKLPYEKPLAIVPGGYALFGKGISLTLPDGTYLAIVGKSQADIQKLFNIVVPGEQVNPDNLRAVAIVESGSLILERL